MFIFLIIALSCPVKTWANVDCVVATNGAHDKHFSKVDLSGSALPDPLVKALNDVNINRPGLFSSTERFMVDLDFSAVDVVVGKAKVSEPKPGILIDPSSQGCVVTEADPSLTLEKSQKLLNELTTLKKVGNLSLFSHRLYNKGMIGELKDEGHNVEFAADDYAQIDDQLFVDKFIQHIKWKINISDEQLQYIRVALSDMVKNTRIVQGPNYQKKINGIRMRWKSEGSGADFDTIHRDEPDASVATTLALIGAGTEVFYVNKDTIEVRGVAANYISNLLGMNSGYTAVRHRASTMQGPRIVFIIFWN